MEALVMVAKLALAKAGAGDGRATNGQLYF
jgi:hypothetical protein